MALSAGWRLGPYEIVDALGVGGMGEVYRARDTRLNRDVAVKTLLPAVANDPERLARFTREAQVLALLNHPNIAQIYGLEESADGIRGLVMELVEGPTLADRLERGVPLDVGTALRIARQVAEALEAAHERGIIHRDLKPANIKIRDDGMVKVLDFGLAKALGPPDAALGSGPHPTSSPTITSPAMTAFGMILGTAAYMSPEQAGGRVADKRSDMWSFGVVLMEMLTGRRLFDGETISHVLAAVLKDEPDWTTLPPDTPAPVRKLLRRCLEKDRTRRLDSAAAARFDIDDALASPVDTPSATTRLPSRRGASLWAVAGAASVATAIATWMWLRPGPPAPPQLSRFAIAPPPAQMLSASIVGARSLMIARDGTRLVYLAGAPPRLVVRAIDQLEARALPGIVYAFTPFLSPDGRWIGFWSGDQLLKVSINGGAPIGLCRVGAGVIGASWGDDDTIVFATVDTSTGLLRVSAEGGEAKVLTRPDSAAGEIDHAFPSVLPAGRGVLFTVTAAGGATNGQVAVLDFKTGQRKTLIRGGTQAEYVESSAGSAQQGYLIYASGGAIYAVRFNLASLEVVGDPVLIVDRVMTYPTGAGNFSVSRNGTLVYAPAPSGVGRSLVWVTRQGTEEPLAAPPRAYAQPRLSPDGKRVAVATTDREDDILIWNLNAGTLTSLTSGPEEELCPVWTYDGQRLVFSSTREGVANIFWQAADGSGTPERLTTSPNQQYPSSMSRDGELVFQESAPKTAADLMLLTMPGMDHPAGVRTFLQTPYRENNGEVSPDGHWLAYQSNESNRNEIYVRPFPVSGERRWPVSVGGGVKPLWARDGREVFYLNDTSLMSVRVQTSPVFSAANPTKLFDGQYFAGITGRTYDVSLDGNRFLMIKSASTDTTATPADMVVVLNWTEELKAKFKR
jgi:eukaryotic-like serine/threonine-protein kinase